MEFGLKGKRALVTGGSKGIGLAIKKALENEGVEVISWSRSEGVDLQLGCPEIPQVDFLINNVGGGGSSNKKIIENITIPVIPEEPSEVKETPKEEEQEQNEVAETTQVTEEEAGFFKKLWNTITGNNLVTGQVLGSIENLSVTRNLIISGMTALIILLGFFGFKTFYKKKDN